MMERLLGRKQAERMLDFGRETVRLVRLELDAGNVPRSDGFFDPSAADSDAQDLYEAAMLVAGDTPRTRKIHHLAALMASLFFRADISAVRGEFLLELVDQLTYRQLILLSAFVDGAAVQEIRECHPDGRGRLVAGDEIEGELNDLGTRRLLGTAQAGGVVFPFGSGRFSAPSVETVDLGDMALTPLGMLLYDLTDPRSISRNEQLRALAAQVWTLSPNPRARDWQCDRHVWHAWLIAPERRHVCVTDHGTLSWLR
jgi:hypothetical protein